MQNASRHKIITRAIKNGGKDIGKYLLKASYPITGLLPARCQHYLADRFESYNPVTATKVSGATQFTGSWPTIFYGIISGEYTGPTACLMALFGLYNQWEGILRMDNPENGKGSMVLKAPLAPFEYLYNKITQGKNDIELEKELFPQKNIV